MVPEDAVFWISTIEEAPYPDPSVLCLRHADAMVVPRGWTLDDRREDTLRLFKPKDPGADADPARRRRSRRTRRAAPEQLQIDGTGETPRPTVDVHDDDRHHDDERDAGDERGAAPWQPDFDADDDLDGLLEVSSPLLARAFRGTDRRRA